MDSCFPNENNLELFCGEIRGQIVPSHLMYAVKRPLGRIELSLGRYLHFHHF